jgi:hypothetical protein
MIQVLVLLYKKINPSRIEQNSEALLTKWLSVSMVCIMISNIIHTHLFIHSLIIYKNYPELLSKDTIGAGKQIDIGTPYNAKHLTHVGFDAKSGQFTGLPPDWQILLKYSGITETEQMRHPQVSLGRPLLG